MGLSNAHLAHPGGSAEAEKAGTYFHTYIVDWDSPSGQGPIISANRPLRIRMVGGVGRDG